MDQAVIYSEITEQTGKWATDICGRQIFFFNLYVMQKLFF